MIATRNPYTEIECSDHYSRAIASYGAFLTACGYRYDGAEGKLGFGPRLSPEDFRVAFTTAESWGRFTQKVAGGTHTAALEIGYGRLQLKELSLDKVAGTAATNATIEVDGQAVSDSWEVKADRYVLTFNSHLPISAGQRLELSLP